jgi:hypothetical protein
MGEIGFGVTFANQIVADAFKISPIRDLDGKINIHGCPLNWRSVSVMHYQITSGGADNDEWHILIHGDTLDGSVGIQLNRINILGFDF